LASFLNSSGQSEALLIHDDGELCHLLREPLSRTDWNIVGIGAQIDTIIVASSNSMATLCQAIASGSATHDPVVNSNLIVYGMSSNGDLVGMAFTPETNIDV
jgi:hypothetical protein